MNRRQQTIILFAIIFALAFALTGCDRDSGEPLTPPDDRPGEYVTPPEGEIPPIDMNYPYEPDTPAPAPHEGTFVSDYGTMIFNGDGETVVIDFGEELAARLGLPTGEQEATYQFFSGDLPPHGHVMIRYDAAMDFELTVGEGDDEKRVMIEIGKYEDGHYFTGTDCTTADRITMFVDDANGDWEAVDFIKK